MAWRQPQQGQYDSLIVSETHRKIDRPRHNYVCNVILSPQGSEAANPRCSEAGLLAPWFLKLAAWSQGFPPRAVTIQMLQVRASAWSWGDRDGSEQEAWFPSSHVSTAGLCIGDSHPRVSHIGQGSTACRVIETNTRFQGEGTWATTMQFTLAVNCTIWA